MPYIYLYIYIVGSYNKSVPDMDIDKGLWGPTFHALYWNHRIFHVDASAEKDMLGSGLYLEPAIVLVYSREPGI